MNADPDDPLDDVLEAPLVTGPRRPVTIAVGIKLAKKATLEKKLAKAEADFERYLTKLISATRRVQKAREQVRRYRKILQEERT
jgi:outer membrane protein TolC